MYVCTYIFIKGFAEHKSRNPPPPPPPSHTHTLTHSRSLLIPQAADIVQAIQKAYRSASKGISKTRKESTSSVYGQPRNSGADVKRVMPRMNMEDEDELLEFKKTPGPLTHGPSKKSLMRVSSEIISSPSSLTGSSPRASTTSESFPSNYSRSSRPTPTPPKDRRWAGKRGTHRHSDDVFTREDKVYQLSSAVEKIKENNSFLRDKCK